MLLLIFLMGNTYDQSGPFMYFFRCQIPAEKRFKTGQTKDPYPLRPDSLMIQVFPT